MFYVWWPLWPDLDVEPSLISNIYSISVLPYISRVFEVRFGPKLIILRSLRLVTWKPRFWLLTWPWLDTWPHLENLGVLWDRLIESFRTPHRSSLCGKSFASYDVGAFNAPPPPSKSRVAKYPSKCRVKGEKNERQRWKPHENSFWNHFGHFWLRSKLKSPGVKIPKFSKTVLRQ